MVSGKIHKYANYPTTNQIIFRKITWVNLGKYTPMDSGEDRDLLKRLQKNGFGEVHKLPERQTSFVYCWGNGVHHISGSGKSSAYADTETHVKQLLQMKRIARGRVLLRPRPNTGLTKAISNWMMTRPHEPDVPKM